MIQLRPLLALKLLLFTWFFVHYTAVQAFTLTLGVPNDKTVTSARCYANCLTLTSSVNNETEEICNSPACQECLRPCEKQLDEANCISSCGNSTMCVASCRFITAVRNFTSIGDGDGSVPLTPDIPTVKDMNVSSVTLEWPHVLNTTGTPVYLIGMRYSGDASSFFTFYFSKVFTETRATLSVGDVCSLVLFSPFLPRALFQGILFKFQVAVLTENSSISYGQFTSDITLPKPQPVSNVTLEGFAFDPAQDENEKLAVHSSWTPPDQAKHLVTKYTMVLNNDFLCSSHGLPVIADNNGPQPNGTLYLNEKLTKCTYTLTVYAMISCTASDPVSLSYEYPGCINVTNYPRDLCYKYDPPPSPLEEREVNNISYHVVSIANDYTLSINLTWKPPVYPYREVEKYIVNWVEMLPLDQHAPDHYNSTIVTHVLLELLRPAVNYTVSLQPVYKDEDQFNPLGVLRRLTLSTSAPDPNEVQVQNLTFGNFTLSTQTGTFSLNISWQKPPFNYSEISTYAYSYQLGQGSEKVSTTNKTHFTIPRIVHGEPISFKITPIYKHIWIKGTEINRETAAPKPLDERNTVTELVAGTFIEDQENNTYSVEFTWEHPLFTFSKVIHYNLAYESSGYPHDHLPCRSSNERQMCTENGVKTRQFTLSGIRPREFIRLEVVPVYLNHYITGRMLRIDQTAPEPREELVKVVGLERGEVIPSANGMFDTTIKWQKPLFKHSEVKYYQYNTTVNTDPQRRRRSTATSTRLTTKNTTVNLHGIERDKEYTFEVTPVFNVDAVTGRTEKLSIFFETPTALASTDSLSGAEVAGLVIGLLVALLVMSFLLMWWFKEREKRKKKAQGFVFGKNGLMIDDWEVASDKVSLEKELGEGAFGKVYKGFLKQPPESSQKRHFKSSMILFDRHTIKHCEEFIVAVKMLHDMADSDQRREFMEEIQLMKDVGCHRNIVNMIGCCTIEEPMFLLVEYLPYGDLLHYLRKHRGKVKEYLGDESRGPYRSTYCETYIADSSGGVAIKATRNDRTYVNTPESPKEDKGNIKLLSYSSSRTEEDKDIKSGVNTNNVYVNSQAVQEEDKNEDRKELADRKTNVEEEEGVMLSPGDLMAFAWQISQGMEYLAKKGFVHRDLAARNVLVGENKIAKVADFGLTRHVYEEKVYHAKHNRKLPLKWMSIEAIFDETFTSLSDVWAFGIVMWELVTLGGTPYPSINNRELLRLLKEGYRMEKPDTCNDELFDLMKDCWKETPDERPNFTLVRERLEQMMQKDNPYFDFSALDEGKEYYHVPSFNSLMDESTDQAELDDRDDTELLNNKLEKPKESQQTENEGMVPPIEENDIRDTFGMSQKDTSEKNMDSTETKNVKISISDIEMNLYRPGKRGLVF